MKDYNFKMYRGRKKLQLKHYELSDAVEGLIKETQNVDMFSGWKKHLRYSVEDEEFYTTDFLSMSTTFMDNDIPIISMEAWSVWDANDECASYVKDAYKKIYRKEMSGELDPMEVVRYDKKLYDLATDMITDDYDIIHIIEFCVEKAERLLYENENYDIEIEG